MNHSIDLVILKELWCYMKDLILGFVGGMFGYMVPFYKDYQHGKVFIFGMFITKGFLGMITAWIVGGYLDGTTPFRDAIVFGIGFIAFTVATAIDKDFVVDILELWLGRIKKEPK